MPHITSADLESALIDLEDDWYSAADLLPIYNAWAEREGKEPTNTRMLGQFLVFRLKPASRKTRGLVRYRLNRKIVTGRDWFREPDEVR